ncbi:MAG: LysM peptidoglycan-binding domain-containing protein [Anaerolineae bacterium]|nr:LysM peptidoglycan-binding domain-containing protein [Anaerolineae bacterium]
MLTKKSAVVIGLMFLLLMLGMALPVSANRALPQANYQTPTPNAEGRILYIVQAGDTCLSISLWTGIDQNTLRQLNNLDENCTILEGQALLLGIYQTPTPQPGVPPTPEPQQPTPTPFKGSGNICIYLFEDINGNGIPETGESPLAGGAISITDRDGLLSKTGDTVNKPDPLCFEDLPEGDYNISVAPPQGYNPTTIMNYPLTLAAGDKALVDFGAQLSSAAVPPAPSEGGRSPLLAIFGAVLVLAGIGLGIYLLIQKR